MKENTSEATIGIAVKIKKPKIQGLRKINPQFISLRNNLEALGLATAFAEIVSDKFIWAHPVGKAELPETRGLTGPSDLSGPGTTGAANRFI
jgi:hypothetical protein